MKIVYKEISLHYDDIGKGDVVVLLHGFLENRSMWNTLIPELSKNNRIISIDLLGHGQTECLGYVHTMEAMAESVEALLNHLNIERSIFIGHSMGGYVALAYAELFPKKVNGLCLMNSTAKEDSEERQLNRDRAIAVVKQNHKAFLSMAIANLFGEQNREMYAKVINRLKTEALQMPIQGIIAALEGMKIRKNREPLFLESPYKKLMIIGREDPVLEYDSSLYETKPSTLEIVEFSGGHMSHIENLYDLTYNLLHFNEK